MTNDDPEAPEGVPDNDGPVDTLARTLAVFENEDEDPDGDARHRISRLLGDLSDDEFEAMRDRVADAMDVDPDDLATYRERGADPEQAAAELDALLDEYADEDDRDGDEWRQDLREIGRLLAVVDDDAFADAREQAAEVLDCEPVAVDRHRDREQYRRAESTDILVEDGNTYHLGGVPLRRYKVLNFEIEALARLDVPGEPLMAEVEIRTQDGKIFNEFIEGGIFDDRRKFGEALLGLTLGMEFKTSKNGPSERELMTKLNKYLATRDVPELSGTFHLGLHGDEWVTPDGSLSPEGWTDSPETVYVESSIGIERRIALPTDRADYDENDVATILRELPQTRPAQRFLPVLAWFYAAPFRPHIYDMEGEFNLLNVTGDTGSGKTTSLRYLWRCFGMGGEPFSCGDTTFAHTVTMGATASWPVWFDEYKPSDMEGWQVRSFHNLIRKAATGAVEQRGNQDKSTDEYDLQAPLVISGEQQIQSPAERRRSLLVSFRKATTDDDSGFARAYKELVGKAYEAGGELEVPEDCPDPEDHALAYFRFVTGQDRAEIEERWHDARARLIEFQQDWGLDLDLDDLEIQALQTLIFGWNYYCEFAEAHGVDLAELPDESDLGDALRELAGAVGPEGRRLSHLDQFLELAARAADRGALERGQEYDVIYEGREDEELRIHIPKTYDAISKYVREHDLAGEDLLGSARDYRKRLKEAFEKDDGLVVSYSQKTRGIGNCVGIATRVASDRLDFDRSAFGASEESEETDAGDGALPIGQLDGLRGYRTITVTVLTWDDDLPDGAPEASGTFEDSTGAVDAVCWFDPGEFDVTPEPDKSYRFENVSVGEYDGAPQIELNPKVTSIHEIQQGAGHTGAADAGEGQAALGDGTGDATPDGGEQLPAGEDTDGPGESAGTGENEAKNAEPDDEIVDARGRLREHLRTEHEDGDRVTVPQLALDMDMAPEKVEHAVTELRKTRVLIEEDGEHRVVFG